MVMATQSSSTAFDLQKLIGGAAKLELKLLSAGLEAMQTYMNQASRFSSLAGETVKAMQDDKTTLSDAARKFTAFGRQNTQVFVELSQKLSSSYFEELDRLAESLKSARTNEAASTAPATNPATGSATAAPASPPSEKIRNRARRSRRG
jgi:uncharacterized phage infection (PIP) family protein YhgE